MANETELLAQYAAALRYEDIPADVIERAKQCIADTIAVVATMAEQNSDEIERAARLSKGSPGRALELLNSQGAKYFDLVRQIMSRSQAMDLAAKINIADGLQARGMAEDFTIFSELLLTFIAGKAREAALAGQGAALWQDRDSSGVQSVLSSGVFFVDNIKVMMGRCRPPFSFPVVC